MSFVSFHMLVSTPDLDVVGQTEVQVCWDR